MKQNSEKTNVMRILDARKIPYNAHSYEPDPAKTGVDIAALLGEDPVNVYKTLVTQGKSGSYNVFVIPVAEELDLKKAAKAAGVKAIAMIRHKELLPLTGYVHGGCSPIGMKKAFPTFIDASAAGIDRIFVSAGRVGFQIELAPEDLIRTAGCRIAELV